MVDRFIVVDVVSGRLEAELVHSYLQAQGIRCEINQESAGWIHGLVTGPLGEVEILVPSRQGKQARQAIKAYHQAQQKG